VYTSEKKFIGKEKEGSSNLSVLLQLYFELNR